MVWQMYVNHAIVIVSFLAFILIKFYFLRKKKIIDGDVFTYHLIAKQCEDENGIPSYLKCYCIDAKHRYPFDYPFLFIYLFSLLPKDFRDTKYKYINPIIQIIGMIIIGGLLYLLFDSQDVSLCIFGVCMIFMTPGIVRTELDFCARTFAENIYMCIILCGLLFVKTGIVTWLIPVVVLSVILFYSHKFEVQVFLILSITYIFGCGDISWFLFFVVLLVGLVLCSSKYRLILLGHCRFLLSCYKKFKIKKNNSISNIAMDNAKLVISNPLIVVIIYLFIINDAVLHENVISMYSFWGAIGIFCASILIRNVRYLFFIGSGDRYVDYTAIFTTCFLLSGISTISITGMHIIILFYLLVDVMVMAKFYNKAQSDDVIEIIEFGSLLRNRKENNIFFDKAGQFYNLLAYVSGKAVYGALSSYGSDEVFDMINKDVVLDCVIKKYDIEIVVSGADGYFQDSSQHSFSCIYSGKNWKAYAICD